MKNQHSQRKVMTHSEKLLSRLSRLAAVAVILGYQSHVFAKCDDDWLAIDEHREGDVLALTARNLADFPITYSVRIRPQAASQDQRYSRSKRASGTLEGHEAARLMTLPGADIDAGDELSISCTWTIGNRNATHDDNYLYMLPYASGTSYRVIQGFDSRFSHSGVEQFAVDFKMDTGTPVHAARDGVVARIEESNDKGCWQDGCGQYANFIVIMHDDGTTGEYYHLQQNGALVEVGDRVVAGQKIGLSGNTGHTALPHLHFAVYKATRRALAQSVPVAFVSADGVVYRPRRGHRYLAVSRPRAGD
jgi:murein DD-endopeptidase MepM/ murein hydrolase activator NlpD